MAQRWQRVAPLAGGKCPCRRKQEPHSLRATKRALLRVLKAAPAAQPAGPSTRQYLLEEPAKLVDQQVQALLAAVALLKGSQQLAGLQGAGGAPDGGARRVGGQGGQS